MFSVSQVRLDKSRMARGTRKGIIFDKEGPNIARYLGNDQHCKYKKKYGFWGQYSKFDIGGYFCGLSRSDKCASIFRNWKRVFEIDGVIDI